MKKYIVQSKFIQEEPYDDKRLAQRAYELTLENPRHSDVKLIEVEEIRKEV